MVSKWIPGSSKYGPGLQKPSKLQPKWEPKLSQNRWKIEFHEKCKNLTKHYKYQYFSRVGPSQNHYFCDRQTLKKQLWNKNLQKYTLFPHFLSQSAPKVIQRRPQAVLMVPTVTPKASQNRPKISQPLPLQPMLVPKVPNWWPRPPKWCPKPPKWSSQTSQNNRFGHQKLAWSRTWPLLYFLWKSILQHGACLASYGT